MSEIVLYCLFLYHFFNGFGWEDSIEIDLKLKDSNCIDLNYRDQCETLSKLQGLSEIYPVINALCGPANSYVPPGFSICIRLFYCLRVTRYDCFYARERAVVVSRDGEKIAVKSHVIKGLFS